MLVHTRLREIFIASAWLSRRCLTVSSGEPSTSPLLFEQWKPKIYVHIVIRQKRSGKLLAFSEESIIKGK